MTKVLVVAGEPSGDLHAAEVIKHLVCQCPEINFFGMGGDLMQQAGVRLIYHIRDSAVMGFTEVVSAIPKFALKQANLKKFLRQERPSMTILVDFSGFNLGLAKYANRLSLPVIYYIPPKAWAWRASRARAVARSTSAVASIFPFEANFYKQAGANTYFVGHPLLDIAKSKHSVSSARKELGINSNGQIIGLMPGSRQSEVNTLLPLMTAVANRLRQRFPESQFILPLAAGIKLEAPPYITIVSSSQAYTVMRAADLMLIASGTATLESALIGTPMIIVYQLSTLTWWLSKRLVQLAHSGLPNIIAGYEIVPELLQKQANLDRVFTTAENHLSNPELLTAQRQRLSEIRKALGDAGAAGRVADLVRHYLP